MKKILVVDNDRIVRKFVTKLLEKEGHQVVTAKDGLDAIYILKTYKPDFIMIDLVMPNIDGRMLCKIIRGMPDFKDTYLIIISATAAEEIIDIAQLGADAYIAKVPFNEMGQYILNVLDQPDLASSQCLSGEIIGINSIYPRGVTKELLSVKKHFEIILETISEGILEINSEGKVVFANLFVFSMIDIPEEKLLGSHFADIFSGDDRQRVRDLLKITDGKPKIITEGSPARLNKYQVTVNILPLDEDGSTSIIILHDVSESKRAEEDIRLAQKAAEAANCAKSDFLANMSHELRTPLNSILGFSQILQEKYFGDLNEKQGGYVGHILASGNHLLSLINDILDLAKVESGKEAFEPTRVKIENLLENSLVMIREKALKHNISLDLHMVPELADFEITADERKLKQVIYNLLSNAAKFTPDGGSIRVAAQSSIINHQSSIQISVADSGIGIAPENIEKIFEEFHQVQDDSRYKLVGTGLGLALSKRFVEMHGGKIWVESKGKDLGSRFSFIVPTMPAHLEEAEPETKKGPYIIKLEAEATLLIHLSRAVSLSERYNKPVTLCRLLSDKEHLKQEQESVKRVLEKEKRGLDSIVMDHDGNFYLILQQTGRQQAKVTCDRFTEKLEGVLEGLKISWSMATFPDNGKDAVILLEKVGIQPE